MKSIKFNYLFLVFALIVFGAVSVRLSAGGAPTVTADELIIENIRFSPETPTVADILEVSGNIKNFRNSGIDWYTLQVWKKGEFRGDGKGSQFVARDEVRWNFFWGNPNSGLPMKCRIDISTLSEGDYSVYIYAQVKDPGKFKEIYHKISDFKIDNAKLFADAGDFVLEKQRKEPLAVLGVEIDDPENIRIRYPIRNNNIFLKQLAAGSTVNLVCQVRNDSNWLTPCSLEGILTDAYFRGGKTGSQFSLMPGEIKLIRLRISSKLLTHLVDFVASNKKDSQRPEARAILKLQSGGNLISATSIGLRFCELPTTDDETVRTISIAGNADKVKVDPVWGTLTLIESIDCARRKPDMEGGKFIGTKYSSEPLAYYGRNSLNYDYFLNYLDTTHDHGFTSTLNILGRECRIADNWGGFCYKLGGGRLENGKRYLVEMDFPEDQPRTFCIFNNTSESPGFHTGPTIGDPFTRQLFTGISNFPLSGCYQTWRGIAEATENGIKFSVHSMGTVAAPRSAGIAVSAIRLYKIETTTKIPEFRFPPNSLPRRSIIWIQEDGPAPARKRLEEIKAFGFSGIAPIFLHYCGKGTGDACRGEVDWTSKLFAPDRFNNRGGVAEESLRNAGELGLDVYPNFEYGGTSLLPQEAYAVEPDGSKSCYYWGTVGKGHERVIYRIPVWHCIDIAHPAVAEDFNRILDELTPLLKENKAIKGIELSHRFNCWQISWSEYEMIRFAKETGTPVPALSQAEKARWIANNALDKYWKFFYVKKRENMLSIRNKLQSIRPDLVLQILNYVADDHLPFGQILYAWANSNKRANEFIDLRRPEQPCLPNFRDNLLSIPGKNIQLDLRELLEDYRRVDQDQPGICPPLYKDDKGIVIWGPMHYEFTAASPTYLNFFRTGEGLGIYNNVLYNEDCNLNLPGVYNPGLQGTEHAGKFSVMEEVMAVAAADPTRLGVRIGVVCRGFPEYWLAFSRAYLSLPAFPSEVIASGCDDKDIVVRRIETVEGIYFAVINRSFSLEEKKVSLSCFPQDRPMIDLVSGEEIGKFDNKTVLKLMPMSLRTFLFPKKH